MTPIHWADVIAPIQAKCLAAGALLITTSFAGVWFNPGEFFRSYLVGILWCTGVALGSMAFLMVYQLTGGAWGRLSRPLLVAAANTLPLTALLFVPVLFGLGYLYDWAHPDAVLHSTVLLHRSAYMNRPCFIFRTIAYFAIWITLIRLLSRNAERPHSLGSVYPNASVVSSVGLILYLFSMSFASVDWAESLESRWASSIWGLMFIAAQGTATLGFVILVSWLLSRKSVKAYHPPSLFHDLGTMLFAAVMLSAYFRFSQYLIVWSENLPRELSYYLTRTATSWKWLGLVVAIGGFGLPILFLLSRHLKQSPALLSGVAVLILGVSYLDLIWIVLPAHYKAGFQMSWLDFVTPMGIAGVWSWRFLGGLRSQLDSSSAWRAS